MIVAESIEEGKPLPEAPKDSVQVEEVSEEQRAGPAYITGAGAQPIVITVGNAASPHGITVALK